MTTTISIALLLIGAAALAVWATFLVFKDRSLDKKAVALDQWYIGHLEEKKKLENIIEVLGREVDSLEGSKVIDDHYTVTESDEMRYSSDQAIINVAKNRVAHVIAFDIMKNFEPVIDEVNGRKRIGYKLRVTEVE